MNAHAKPEPLKADANEIERFVRALFVYASPGTYVSLRAFYDAKDDLHPYAIRPLLVDDLTTVCRGAERLATEAAGEVRPIVFCPPIATFKTADNAKQGNLAEGLALSIECDQKASAGRSRLEALLGLATVAVESGGQWTDPETGEVEPKLHVHWRLTEPAATAEDQAALKEARALAARIVGADTTNVPTVHPIRWPGSWHRKAEPKLAAIVALNEGAEIDLHEALELLREAAGSTPGAAPKDGTLSIDAGTQKKSADDYLAILKGMAIDGQKHGNVRDMAASLAAQGCSERFVEAVCRYFCPVWDANAVALMRSGFDKYRKDTATAQTGDDPVDLWGTFPPPALPSGLLPEVIESFAKVQGDLMGADPSGLAVAALVTCAATITDEIKLQVKRHDTWTESARLWAALVGSPSTKKSPILSAATAPLCRIDGDMFREWQGKMQVWGALSKEEKATTPAPKQKRLRIGDTTPEAAQQVLEGSPDGVMCLQDELSGFFGSMDRYAGAKGSGADRAFWLQAFNGGEFALNRVGRGAALIPNLSVCLLGGIQPEPIRKIAADAADDGLLQRLFPIILKPATMGRDEPAPDAVGTYRDLVDALHKLKPPSGTGEALVKFSDAAQAIRRELEAKHLDLQSSEAVSRKLASHIGKYDGLFARLCLTWHCIEFAKAEHLPETIGEATARRVATFLHTFLLRHAVAFYAGTLGLSDDHDRLTAIAGYILAHKLEVVTNRHVQRGDRAMRAIREADIRPLLEQLAALGWLTKVDGPKPTLPPHWAVNPAVHVRFADRAKQEAARRGEAKTAIQAMLGSQA